MLREGLAAGVRPLGPSTGLAADVVMCGLLALAAWWWLPRTSAGDGPRGAAAWALRFLLLAWVLALALYAWALAAGHLAPWLTWPVLVACFVAGVWLRRGASPQRSGAPALRAVPWQAAWGGGVALAWFLALIPHLVFPYHYTDAQQIWACRAFKFAGRGALPGVFACPDPVRPPLHSLILWLGGGDPTVPGRLLPLLMFGASALVFFLPLGPVAPRLAPRGLVGRHVPVHAVQCPVSATAGVPRRITARPAAGAAGDGPTRVRGSGAGVLSLRLRRFRVELADRRDLGGALGAAHRHGAGSAAGPGRARGVGGDLRGVRGAHVPGPAPDEHAVRHPDGLRSPSGALLPALPVARDRHGGAHPLWKSRSLPSLGRRVRRGPSRRQGPRLGQPAIHPDVGGSHHQVREVALRVGAAGGRAPGVDGAGRLNHLVQGVAQGADLGGQHLRKRAASGAQHRGAGEQRFDGGEPERLVPPRRHPP